MQIKQNPHSVFLLTGLVLILISFFVMGKDHTVDIHLHDTYFIIAHAQLFWLFAFLALAAWMLYALTDKILYSKTLSWIHVTGTILTLSVFVLTLNIGSTSLLSKPQRYYDFNYGNLSGTSSGLNQMMQVSIGLLVVSQMIFIINIFTGLLKRRP